MANVFGEILLEDDVPLLIGTSSDFKVKYDTGDSRLEILDAADNVLGHIVDDGSTGTLTWLGGLAISSGAISAGTSTPTLSAGVNVASSTGLGFNYLRVGNVVNCSFRANITPTAGAPTLTTAEFSLPVASNFSGTGNARGSLTWKTSSAIGSCYVDAVAANDTIKIYFYAASTNAHDISGTFQYVVI
jgi:hypothetical protein